MIQVLETPNEYKEAMDAIETHLAKGLANLTETDLADLQWLSLLVERYEDQRYPMPLKIA